MTSKPPPSSSLSNPLLEVNPSACLFVLGPTATGSKSCKELMEAATAFLQTQKKISFSAKKKLLSEIKMADQTDVGSALQRAIDGLIEMNSFLDWLQFMFQGTTSPTPLSPSKTLEHLLELQKQGAMLACTQLDSLPGTKQATLHDDDSFKTWLRSGLDIDNEEVDVVSDDSVVVLHLCGLYSQPKSIWMGGENTQLATFAQLKRLLQERLVIFVGFSSETQNRFVLNFLDKFYSASTGGVKYPPMMLTSSTSLRQRQRGSCKSDDNAAFSHFLTLQVQEGDEQLLGNLISSGSKKNFSVARGLTDKQTDSTKYQAFLLFNEKQSFRKLGEIIYRQSRSGEIYVRRDALTVMFSSGRILYSNIITYGGNGLRQLWELVLTDGSSLLGKGLVGFGLQNSAIVWIRGRPEGLGDITDVNTTYAGKSSVVAATIKNKSYQMSVIPPAQARLSQDTAVSYQPPTTVTTSKTTSSPTSTSVYNVTGDSLFNIPPPPKLIKIKDNKSNPVATARNPSSTPPPAILSPPPSHSPETGEAKCMQAIIDLQERISQQLNSSSDSLTLATSPTMVKLKDQSNIASSFCPPSYCIAGLPELLLDIIGQTSHVRMHEHTIELIDRSEVTQNLSLTKSTPRPTHIVAADRKRKRPPSSEDEHPSALLTLTPPPTSTPTLTPVTRNQTNVSNILMTASPNYCLALNTFPVMLVNSTMSLVQPIPSLPLAAGLPTNQVLCYMTPDKLVSPLSATTSERTQFNAEQRRSSSESTLVTTSLLHTPLSLSPPSRADSAVDSSPLKIERVCNKAVSNIVSAQKQDVSEAVATTESDYSDDYEAVSLAPHSILSSDGSVQLWVFLLELLLSPDHKDVIHWTGQRYEFHIAQPAVLARLWGHHRNKPQMTYEKMSRALRYYYSRGIIESVRGRKQTFRFSIDILEYVTLNKDQTSVDYLQSCCQL